MAAERPVSGVIVGLGRIGFGFNADSKRHEPWTHERAYALSRRVRLAAAVDADPSARARFSKARPAVAVYADVSEALRLHTPDLVSICTPTPSHVATALACLDAGVRAVFCEKPLAADTAQADALVRRCRESGATLAVNHWRRWDPAFRRAAASVARGDVGKVLSVSARYSGHIYNVGTHLLDAVRMLTGLEFSSAAGQSPEPSVVDPHVSGLLAFHDGAACAISCHGRPSDLLFEVDILGDAGRVQVLEMGRRTVLARFAPSRRYGGYRELSPLKLGPVKRASFFVEAVRDLCACLDRKGRAPACTGEDGFKALAAAEAITLSCRDGGSIVRIARLSGAPVRIGG